MGTTYEMRNPALIFALTETTNELILFQLLSSKTDCSAIGRLPFSEVNDRTLFDSLEFFGPLIVARSVEDASLHMI